METWYLLDKEGFPNYMVSDLGNYKNIRTGKITNGVMHTSGFRRVSPTDENGKMKQLCLHKLIAAAFCDNPNKYKNVIHLDKDNNNNTKQNLKWVSDKEVNQHKNKNKVHKGRNIYQLNKEKEILKEWDKLKHAAQELDILRSNISTAAKKGTICGGYFWIYCDQYDEIYKKLKWKTLKIKNVEKIKVCKEGYIKYKTGKITKGNKNKHGYFVVSLRTLDGKVKNYLVHKLVARKFIGKAKKDLIVNHRDGNKGNNNFSNLEYISPKENNIHAIKMTLRKKNKTGRAVNQLDVNGDIINTFRSAAEAYRQTSVSKGNIISVCRGRRPKAGGFRWEYAS